MEVFTHTLVHRCARLQEKVLGPVRQELGLGPGQPRLLRAVKSMGPCPQGKLAGELGIDPAAVSRTVDLLVRNGFLSRRQVDGRTVEIALTDKGEDAVAKWTAKCSGLNSMMAEGLTDGEVAMFRSLLERVWSNLKRMESEL